MRLCFPHTMLCMLSKPVGDKMAIKRSRGGGRRIVEDQGKPPWENVTPCFSGTGWIAQLGETHEASVKIVSSNATSASPLCLRSKRTLPAARRCGRYSESAHPGACMSCRPFWNARRPRLGSTRSCLRAWVYHACFFVSVLYLSFARDTTALLVRPSIPVPPERNRSFSGGRVPRGHPSLAPLLPATGPLVLPHSLISLSNSDISVSWVPQPGSNASPDGPVLPGLAQEKRNLAGFPMTETDGSSSAIQQCMKELEEEFKQLRGNIPPFGCPASTVGSWNTVYVLYAPFEGLIQPVLPQTYLRQLSALKAVAQQRGWHVDPAELSPGCAMALKWLHCKAHDVVIMCGGTASNWQYQDSGDQATAREYCSKKESPVFQACGKATLSTGTVPEVYPFKGCRAFNAETGQNPPGTVIVYTGGTVRSAPTVALSSLVAAPLVLWALTP